MSTLIMFLVLSISIVVHAETHGDHHDDHKESAHKTETDSPKEHKKSTAEKTTDTHKTNTKNKDEPATESQPPKILPSDVRVLIDISGSMKKTDPQNLRKSAVNLISRLLPDKSKAGIWVFGQSVNVLMPHNLVDAEWRKQAASKSNDINSTSAFTNIGKALEEVSFDRNNPGADYKTHIILLTDGVVDISKEAVENVKERQRVLAELLPDLKSAGYVIHTIALSSDADADLLKKISIATDGVFTTALSADDLTSTFLKIFDQAVPAERVPLENNGFLVDSSIKEFTALIFRKDSHDKSVIIAPDNKEFSDGSQQDQINWYRTDTYDLITVTAPKPGQWKIKTDITPQSRVTIVSNLQLVVQPLKTNLRLNDNLAISYSFLENDKTIVNKDFLGLLEASVVIAKESGGEKNTIDVSMPEPPEDGLYNRTLTEMKEPGNYEMHLYIDGKTFKREFKYSFSVIGSVLSVSKNNIVEGDEHADHSYKIFIDQKLVDLKKVKVIATVKDPHASTDKPLELIDNNHWEFSLSPTQTGDYEVTIHAQGDMLDGSKLDETVTAETFSYEAKEEHKPAEPAAPEKATDEKHDGHIVLFTGIGVGILLLAILSFFGYRMLSNKTKEDLEIERTLAPTKKPAPKDRVVERPTKSIEMDLSDDNLDHIPMTDDLMSESAFPLDSMEDANKDEQNT